MTQEHSQNFNTDVARLLDIVANALYSNKDVFLRELISNAADACDRLRYEGQKNPALLKDNAEFKIHVQVDAPARQIVVTDNGIGMNDSDLAQNLGTIAHSGTKAVMDNLGQDKDLSLIGQFGVGFYAAFMVADQVIVKSRRAGEDKTWQWTSDGRTGFTITESDEPIDQGTQITLHIKDDSSEYLVPDKIRSVILAYSDHINVPIYFNEEDTPANVASALWTRPKNEITPEQYKEFYKNMGHVFDEPLITAHWKAEGVIEYTALLFVPTMRPWDLYDPSRKSALRLYVRRVFITDQLESLVYPWMRFVRGVIDSADLPLNISREMLQQNPVLDKIRRGVTKRVLNDLAKLAQDDPIAFDTFWHQFGAVLKEGLYDAAEHREDIFNVCRFVSSESNNQLVSLEDYLGRMKDGQDKIYYMTGEKLEHLQNSPQIEGFKARGIEVLFFTDTVDSFWLQMVDAYQDKKFVSITQGDIDLPETQQEKTTPEEKDEKQADLSTFIGFLKETLGDKVGDVRPSKRLTDSPVCLVAAADGADMHMERYLKMNQQYDPVSKKILEINPNHALVQKLAAMAENDSSAVVDSAYMLYDQALIIQGEPVDDPSAFARRMAQLMERGLAA